MLEGSVSAVGSATVVALAATDCTTGATIARQQVDVERKEDVLRAMGTITAEVREALGESRDSLARHNVTDRGSDHAVDGRAEGLHRRHAAARRRPRDGCDPVLRARHRARSALRAGLHHAVDLYGGLGETGRSEELARLAYENREHVSERERLFITYQYHDRFTGDQTRAQETLDVWKRTYPRDYRPANALAVLFNGSATTSGDRRSGGGIKRNPAHAVPQIEPGGACAARRRQVRRARAVAEAVARNLGTGPLRRLLYQLSEMQGDQQTARAQLDWATTSSVGFDLTGAARRSRRSAAGCVTRRLYGETIAGRNREGYKQIGSGAYAALGGPDRGPLRLRHRGRAGVPGAPDRSAQRAPTPRWPPPWLLAGALNECRFIVRRCARSARRTRSSTPPTSPSPKPRSSCALGSDPDFPRLSAVQRRRSRCRPRGSDLDFPSAWTAPTPSSNWRPAAGHERESPPRWFRPICVARRDCLPGISRTPCANSGRQTTAVDPFSPVWPPGSCSVCAC